MEGKVVVVTGSTSGIGVGVAREFLHQGCSVVITGLGTEEQTDKVLNELRSTSKGDDKVHFVPAELTNTDSIDQFCVEVDKLHPNGIDILVNNAGIQYICPIDEYPLDVWQNMLAIGMTAPFMLIKHFLPKMKEKGWGRIINMSSQMAVISDPGKAPYSAYKAGICGLTRGTALEVGGKGITCNAICPSMVDSPMMWNQIARWSEIRGFTDQEEGKREFVKQNVTQLISIQEVADYIVFLCSDAARGVNGASLMIDAANTIR